MTNKKQNVIICLGLHASGSTWIFNVVREICKLQTKKAISFFSEKFDDFIGKVEFSDDVIIVKCHRFDNKILNISRIFDVSIIVSTRNYKDCIVSQCLTENELSDFSRL